MSKKENRKKITLNGSQLCAAGQMLGYDRLLLPKDPFQGWLVEEIEEGTRQAREELIEAELITPLGAEGIEVEEDLLSAIAALGAPEYSLLLNRSTPDEATQTIYFHYTKEEWVAVKPVEEGNYQLETLSDNDNLTKRALRFLAIHNQTAALGKPSALSPDEYQEARELAINQNEVACETYLTQAGVNEATSPHLAAALKKSTASGSLVALAWEGRQSHQVGGAAFLEVPSGLWQISQNSNQEERITIAPVSGECFVDNAKTIIDTLFED